MVAMEVVIMVAMAKAISTWFEVLTACFDQTIVLAHTHTSSQSVSTWFGGSLKRCAAAHTGEHPVSST